LGFYFYLSFGQNAEKCLDGTISGFRVVNSSRIAFMQLSQKETLKTAKKLEPNHTPNRIFFGENHNWTKLKKKCLG